MMLGDLLSAARRSGNEMELWLASAAPELWQRVAAEAARAGVSPADFARACVADFTGGASEEAWATLLSRLRTADDPGRECLLEMMRWRLAKDTT